MLVFLSDAEPKLPRLHGFSLPPSSRPTGITMNQRIVPHGVGSRAIFHRGESARIVAVRCSCCTPSSSETRKSLTRSSKPNTRHPLQARNGFIGKYLARSNLRRHSIQYQTLGFPDGVYPLLSALSISVSDSGVMSTHDTYIMQKVESAHKNKHQI